MKHLLCAFFTAFLSHFSFSQTKIKPDKYPSLLWEIKGKGLSKPSYLFGTMHVSSKMAFNLSDSFYLGIKAAQVVALETNPATWQEDFSKYDLEGESLRGGGRYSGTFGSAEPQDYFTINTFKLPAYERLMEAALYSNPSMINNFLYRSRSEFSADFEEDTYLDLHIFQTGKKLGKQLCGVEDFHGSMQLVKEAYSDAAREKRRQERGYDVDENFSYRNMEEAYRTGNLDLLDTINKVNSRSAAFDEKFLYRRNEIQASSIDSILKKGSTLFVGVGAAHLPGERGVIELLRRAGYTLRPILMKQRDSQQKDVIEKIRVPVVFAKQTAEDGAYSVSVPGKLYSFGRPAGLDMRQYADMTNGSYYMVSRLFTNAAILGHTEAQVLRKIDSVLYENIPGKILVKKGIENNGHRGFEILNRTRRGDYQRYNIFVTPFEVLIFKMSGNGEYVKLGTEAARFFSSIQLSVPATAAGGWKKFTPPSGGFEVELPNQPMAFSNNGWRYAAYDGASKTAFQIIRADVHNYSFLEEDSFDLNLMEESFAASDFIQRPLGKTNLLVGGYPALDAKYKCKDSSVATVRFVLNGPRYYAVITKAERENGAMQQVINSFRIKPFSYAEPVKQYDTALRFTVKSPVRLQKAAKLSMYPENAGYGNYQNSNDDDSLIDNGRLEGKVIENDSTEEKIYVSFYKPSAYYFSTTESGNDSLEFAKDWIIRRKKVDTLADKTIVTEMDLGAKTSGRMLKLKSFERAGLSYDLQTLTDTSSAPSTFITSFFQSFSPTDTAEGTDVKKKKSALFFSQLFSTDTTLRKTAIKNIDNVVLEESDFTQLKKGIAVLGWKDKKYLSVKKQFIGKLAHISSKEASDYLKDLYAATGDTVELQYSILETLLQQATTYSYKTFAGILQQDPPVLNSAGGNRSNYNYRTNTITADRYGYDDDYSDGSFMDNLTDSVQLTAGIYKNLVPLLSVSDYEQPLMELTATLLDSNQIGAKDYEVHLPKLLIESKQLLKKQVILEKTKAIEKAQQDEEETDPYRYNRNDADNGNQRLSLYAKLLRPFWDKEPQVPQIINRILASNDKRLKYNTAVLLLRNGRPLPDTLLNYFAAMDEYRYELYLDLKELKKLSLFPATYKNNEAIARSQVFDLQSYNKPDTVAFLEKRLLTHKDRTGYVYVFKYKENKNDNSWKLATIGLLPAEETKYSFDEAAAEEKNRSEYDFSEASATKLTSESSEKEQINKLLKKLVYSKRKSAVEFYDEERDYNPYEYSKMR